MISQFVKKSVRKATVVMTALVMAFPFQVIGFAAPATNAFVASGDRHIWVVTTVQHFGDQPEGGIGVYRGEDHEFTFSAPGGVIVYPAAVLMLQTRHVSFDLNVVQINGIDITGALVKHQADEWFTQVAMIPFPLKATGNVLKITARNIDGNAGGNLDDFYINNVVVIYQVP